MGPRLEHPVKKKSLAPKGSPSMVFAVQCPNAKCRKFMLVEDHDRNKVVPCLLCRTAIKVGGAGGKPSSRPASPGNHLPPAGGAGTK